MPNYLVDIVAFILLSVVSSVFAYFYIGSKKKVQIENGRKALLEEQCGGRFNALNLTIPFVRHAIYDDFIVIAYGQKRYILRYKDLKSVALKRYIVSKGITYLHNRKEIPNPIIIWTLSCDKVLEILRTKNVNINA